MAISFWLLDLNGRIRWISVLFKVGRCELERFECQSRQSRSTWRFNSKILIPADSNVNIWNSPKKALACAIQTPEFRLFEHRDLGPAKVTLRQKWKATEALRSAQAASWDILIGFEFGLKILSNSEPLSQNLWVRTSDSELLGQCVTCWWHAGSLLTSRSLGNSLPVTGSDL